MSTFNPPLRARITQTKQPIFVLAVVDREHFLVVDARDPWDTEIVARIESLGRVDFAGLELSWPSWPSGQ